VIPALASSRQPLQPRLEVPVQLFHQALQRLACGPAAHCPGGIRPQPVSRAFGIALITEILLYVAQSTTQAGGVLRRNIRNNFKNVSKVLHANPEFVQLPPGARTRLQQTLGLTP
jgi:hypothetical protein